MLASARKMCGNTKFQRAHSVRPYMIGNHY